MNTIKWGHGDEGPGSRIIELQELTCLCSRHASTYDSVPLEEHCGGQCILTTLLNTILAQKIS